MSYESDVVDLAVLGRLELADLVNDPECQSFLRRYRDIVRQSRGQAIFGDVGALSQNGLSSGIIGLKVRGDCPMSGGIVRCRQVRARQVYHEGCACAGIPMRGTKERDDGGR